jgi:hypothetical protein
MLEHQVFSGEPCAAPIRSAGLSFVRQENWVGDVNRSATDDFGTQTAAMNQAAHRAVLGQLLQVHAGLAKACAAETYFTDDKLPIDQMIERHVAGHDIAARFTRRDVDIVVALESFDRFDLYQCHMPAAARLARKGSEPGKISVIFKSAPRHRFDAVAVLDGAAPVGATWRETTDPRRFMRSLVRGVPRERRFPAFARLF